MAVNVGPLLLVVSTLGLVEVHDRLLPMLTDAET